MPEYQAVGLRTLERWSSSDKWVRKRKDFWAKVDQMAEKKLASSLVKEQLRTLQTMDDLYLKGVDKLLGPMRQKREFRKPHERCGTYSAAS